MTYFLAKTDPDTYSIDDLERDKQTVWDGVTNPQAVRAIREMKPGDRVFIYHSGGQLGRCGHGEGGFGAPARTPKTPNRPSWTWNSPAASSRPPRSRKSKNPGSLAIGPWSARAASPPCPPPKNSSPGCASRYPKAERSEPSKGTKRPPTAVDVKRGPQPIRGYRKATPCVTARDLPQVGNWQPALARRTGGGIHHRCIPTSRGSASSPRHV